MASSVSGRATFGGLASGIDTKAIIDGLMQIERQPLSRIQSRRADVDSQRGLIRQLNTKLLALRDAARNLDNRGTKLTSASTSEEFLKYASSSTNEDVVTVSAGAGAAAGDIQIEIEQLARGSRRFSTTITAANVDAAIALQTGQSITIALPNGKPDAVPPVEATSITITATDGPISLAALRKQINSSPDNGGKVRADILQISEGNFQLVLSSAEAGTDNQLAITGDLALQDPKPEDDAQNAKFTLFGQALERQSNDVEDVLSGITLNLKTISEKDDNGAPIPVTVSIKTDTDAIASSIQDFINAYNDVVSFIDSQSKYNETTKSSGPLSGDFMVREVQRRLRDVVTKGYGFGESPQNPFAPGGLDANDKPQPGGTVSGIGIKVGAGGKLSLDKDRLKEVLAQDALSVREFLTGAARTQIENQAEIDAAKAYNDAVDAYNAGLPSGAKPREKKTVPGEDFWDAGLFTKIGEQLEDIVRTGDGLLAQRDQQFATRLKDFDKSIDTFNIRLSSREQMLTQRFSALEQVISGLQNQQGFLGSLK
jgi:flagellar hook-associated protein 2